MPSETVYLKAEQDKTVRELVESDEFGNYSTAIQYAVEHTFMGGSDE